MADKRGQGDRPFPLEVQRRDSSWVASWAVDERHMGHVMERHASAWAVGAGTAVLAAGDGVVVGIELPEVRQRQPQAAPVVG